MENPLKEIMPQAQNITVQNASSVDKVFTLLTPAAGDNSLARWALKEGGSPAAFPTMTALARATNNKSRKSQLRIRIPYSYTDQVTGLVKAGPAFEFNGDFTVADEFPEGFRDDAVAYISNLVAHHLVKAGYRDGYSYN